MPRFSIGQKFLNKSNGAVCTVTDILKTYNSKGDLVWIRYVATHEFMGQVITDCNVVDTTIARGVEALEKRKCKVTK